MSAPQKITVLLVEDHVVVRQSLCKLLETEGGFAVIGEARTGRDAVALAASLKPDVILMDIAMPVLNGLGATQQILSANPAARVLVLSAHSDNVYVERMTAAGAVGFVEKQTSAMTLIHAIHEVAGGKSFLSPAVARRMGAAKVRAGDHQNPRALKLNHLTPREQEVLQLVAEGQANKQIAGILGIGISTVEKHRQNLMDKLHLHDTAGLTRYAMVHGIIESSVHVTII
jgi:DNA-binding NarL/FixJ family response regulator